MVLDYLPDPYGKNNVLPNNKFFWTILYTLCHDSVVALIEQTGEERRKKVS